MAALGLAQALVLVAAANAAPVIGKRLLGTIGAWPADGGLCLRDGRPLFGPSKTWRGLALGVLGAIAAGTAMGLPAGVGALAGGAAMAGDLASSFIKRRCGRASSSQALGLDQVPELLLPLLAVAPRLGLDAAEILLGVAVFFVVELGVSRMLHAIGLRDEPY